MFARLTARFARFSSVQRTKTVKNIPNDHRMYQMAIPEIPIQFGRKIDKMAIKIPTSFIARPSKIYPNWDFWFEKSGNTADGLKRKLCRRLQNSKLLLCHQNR
jgi:hypothetical protein